MNLPGQDKWGSLLDEDPLEVTVSAVISWCWFRPDSMLHFSGVSVGNCCDSKDTIIFLRRIPVQD